MAVRCIAVLMLIGLMGCSKESGTVELRYQLETSSPTGDHFYVTYLDANGDSVTEHEHPGFDTAFIVSRPFRAFFNAEVNPIDNYTFTIRILENNRVVGEQSASTASGAVTTLTLNYNAE